MLTIPSHQKLNSFLLILRTTQIFKRIWVASCNAELLSGSDSLLLSFPFSFSIFSCPSLTFQNALSLWRWCGGVYMVRTVGRIPWMEAISCRWTTSRDDEMKAVRLCVSNACARAALTCSCQTLWTLIHCFCQYFHSLWFHQARITLD